MKTSSANSNTTSKIDPDVAFIRSDSLCNIEAVFTTNKFQAAPIQHFLRYDKDFQTDFVLINAKNANAMTGEEGIDDINTIFEKLPIKTQNPIMSSTGVIGYRLNKEKIISSFDKFNFNDKNSNECAKAIMTTDKFKKEISLQVNLENGKSFNISAIAKGAGMINPAMATMLCFVITDANVPKNEMKELLHNATNQSFNTISVDGDTSTNDTLMLLSNAKSNSYDKEAFQTALNMITKHLALEILRDGEGSSKVVAFKVTGAKNNNEAKVIAKKLSNSLLVKTALFGMDPNWGRIASTVGSSGMECDEEKLTIYYDDVLVYSNQQRELSKEAEEKAYKVMQKDSFQISCNIGIGNGIFTAYGCDLSYEYVKINAEYRT